MNVGGKEKCTEFYCLDFSRILLLHISRRRKDATRNWNLGYIMRNGGSCNGHALCSVVAGDESSNFTSGGLVTPSPISSVIALLGQFYIPCAERNKIFVPGVWL
jgi:hypothetical protein